MSPKLSSLAFDEVTGQSRASIVEVDFAPELNLMVKTRNGSMRDSFSISAADDVVEIGGRIIVSF